MRILRFAAAIFAAACSISAQPLLRLTDSQLSSPPVVITYGDMRFTDTKENVATDPKVRRWLVDKIAAEKPNAVIISGDLPWHGGDPNDYAEYHTETAAWRAAKILVSPALGNHELNGGDEKRGLENWWNEFPELHGHRWYEAELGSRIVVLNLDSNSSLLPGSEQIKWVESTLKSLRPSVQFLFFNLHHPPVADVLADVDADHNPRPNEVALAAFLKGHSKGHVRFIVAAGHIHNYERFYRDGTTYLVSGGGGAKPRVISTRNPDDLYQDTSANYHYVKFVLKEDGLDAQMIRVANPAAAAPSWEVKDRFKVALP